MSQYNALLPFITDRISQLARDRLFDGLRFHDGHALRKEFSRGEVKAALLLVQIINPKEFFTGDEQELLSSYHRRTRGKKRE